MPASPLTRPPHSAPYSFAAHPLMHTPEASGVDLSQVAGSSLRQKAPVHFRKYRAAWHETSLSREGGNDGSIPQCAGAIAMASLPASRNVAVDVVDGPHAQTSTTAPQPAMPRISAWSFRRQGEDGVPRS